MSLVFIFLLLCLHVLTDVQSESTRREYHARVAIGCMLISKGAYVDTKSKKGFDPFQFGLFELRESVKMFMKHK